MGIFSKLFARNTEQKESVTRQAIAIPDVGRAKTTPKNYAEFSKEGYQANVIVYKSISLIARTISCVDVFLEQKGRAKNTVQIDEHPLLDLLRRPNPLQGYSAWMESVVAFSEIAGNTYIEAGRGRPSEPPVELWSVQPDKMQVVPGRTGLPAAYVFGSGQDRRVFPVDQVSGKSDILLIKCFHPTNIWYGMSAVEPSMLAIDQHNEASKWNLSLLQNMASRRLAVMIKESATNPGASLKPEQFQNLKSQLIRQFAGSQNAGKLMLLEGGMDIETISMTPQEMDWKEGFNEAARNISRSFGVPPILLNIPGDSTFANFKEARLSFYQDTIIPKLKLIKTELNNWLTPMFGDNLKLEFDIDSIEAISEARAMKREGLEKLTFMTPNEKREESGLDPIDGGDVLLVPTGRTALGIETDSSEDDGNEEPEEREEQDQGTQNEDDEEAEDKPDEEEGSEKSDETSRDHVLHKSGCPHCTHDSIDKSVTQGADVASLEIKQINARTDRQKRAAHKRINAARDTLFSAFEMDLEEELSKQAKSVSEAMETASAGALEVAVTQAVVDSSKAIERVIKKHVSRGLNFFGRQILEAGKSSVEDYETKNQKFRQFAESFVEQRTANAVKMVEGTSIKKARKKIQKITLDALEEGLSIPEAAAELQKELGGLSKSRAMTIARTEIAVVSNQGALEAAKTLEIDSLMKEWVPSQDSRVRSDPNMADHSAMRGIQVPVDEKFVVPPAADMNGPGDPSAPAEQIINCRCVLVFNRQRN